MGYNIGPKIGIDGESEFRAQIRRINDEYKALEAETRALTSTFEANGDEQGKLKSQSAQLDKQIEKQKEKIALLSDAVKKASDKYGEGSLEATRLRGALYDAQATVGKLESEMKSADSRLDQFAKGMEDVEDSTEDANKKLIDFEDILTANFISDIATSSLHKAADLIVDFGKGSVEAASNVKAAKSQFEQTFGDLQKNAESILQEISDDTNIATTRMKGDFTKMYAFMKTAGTESEQALSLSGRAMIAAADNAAYFDKSIEEATEQLQSFLKGNYANDAALGISATETTRNAKANELYAKSFKDLSESQKVEVLLAMVEAGNAASGAIGQAARESDEWTNVTGELSEAMRMLQAELGKPAIALATPMIKDLTGSIYDLLKKSDFEVAFEKLADGMDTFSGSVESAQNRFEKLSKNTEANAYAAELYVRQLKDLETTGLKTVESQKAYAAIVDELNGLLPGMNLAIDEQTGLVDQNTDSIYNTIEALKKKAIFEARQEKYTEILQAQGKAVVDLEEAERTLNNTEYEGEDLKKRLKATSEELSKVHSELAEVERHTASSYAASAGGATDLIAKKEQLRQESSRLGGQLMQLQNQIDANETEQEKLTEAIKEGKAAVSQYDDQLKGVVGTSGAATQKNDELKLSVADVQAQLDQLALEYSEASEAARQSIDTQIGLFDALATESDWTAQKIISNWQNQQAAFDNYAYNLQKAVDMGLDEALVNQLADGTEQSMQILNALVNDTSYSVDEINTNFWKMSQSRDAVANAMGAIESEYNQGMSTIKSSARQDGIYIVDGVAGGVEDYSWRLGRAMQSLGSTGLGAFNRTMEINSPSRKMKKSGKWTVEGAVDGVDENIKKFEQSMEQLANAGHDAFLERQLQSAADFSNVMPIQPNQISTVNKTSIGSNVFNIYQRDGESTDDLVEKVIDTMENMIMQKGDAVGAHNLRN